MSERPSDLMIERLALGELAPDEAARVRAGLGDEADARLAELARDDAETLSASPPAEVAAEVRRRLARVPVPERPSPARFWIPATALVAAGFAVWWFTRPPADTVPPEHERIAQVDPPREPDEVIRIKGDPLLTIDRFAGQGSEPLADGALVQPGDRLQLRYQAAGREQGAIVSIDGGGVATLHFPASVDASTKLASGGSVALDHSYELDDAPDFERFFFVTVRRGGTLEVAKVVEAAEALARSSTAREGALVLPDGYEQRSVSLRKPAR
jgi:hypothetical protein